MSDLRMIQAICAPQIFDGKQWFEGHAVLIDGENILDIVRREAVPGDAHCITAKRGMLAPGFIDIQVNGGGGVMLNNTPTEETLGRMTAGHRNAGTTGLLPTLISDTQDIYQQAAAAVTTARLKGNAGLLGLHIEGPFFDLSRRGTHKAEMIRPISAEDIQWLCSLGEMPLVVTLAPEHAGPGQIRTLSEAGVLVCAGHTNASYEQIQSALAEGLRGFTHLFNAMSPLATRAPGTVGAALDSEDSWVSIIADGHHVHPANIRLAHHCKAAGKMLLVSDAMSTVGSNDTGVEIYGERIELKGGKLVNAEGNLAGSAIGMNDAVRISHQQCGLPLEECLRMASLYPAQFLSLDHKLGRISSKHRADLVLLDQDFRVLDTWVAGHRLNHGRQ